MEKVVCRDGSDFLLIGADGAVRFFRQGFRRHRDSDSAFPQLREIIIHIRDDGVAAPVPCALFQITGIRRFDVPLMGSGVVHDSAMQPRIVEIQEQKDAFMLFAHAG